MELLPGTDGLCFPQKWGQVVSPHLCIFKVTLEINVRRLLSLRHLSVTILPIFCLQALTPRLCSVGGCTRGLTDWQAIRILKIIPPIQVRGTDLQTVQLILRNHFSRLLGPSLKKKPDDPELY